MPGSSPRLSGLDFRARIPTFFPGLPTPKIPLTGLDPVIHVFVPGVLGVKSDVGGRIKSGHGVSVVAVEHVVATGFAKPDSRGSSPGKGVSGLKRSCADGETAPQ